MDSTPFGHCPKLPENVKDVFRELCQAVAEVHRKWRCYLDLFAEQDNQDLMNRRAPAAFSIIEEALRNDITMGISRINDPKETYGKKNLSLANLCHRVGPNPPIEALRTEFGAACKPFKDYRNARVGHNNLKTLLGHPEASIPAICKQDVEQCLKLAAKLMNALYRAAGGDDAEYSFHVLEIGGGTSLIECLRLADQQIEAKRKNWLL
jgi:hypothetical protein